MERARGAYAENYRMAVLQRQARDWQMATELTKYVEAMKATRAETDGSWIDWAEGAIERLDPMGERTSLEPVVPEPKPDELKPYLGSWNPYGPGQAADGQ
jgi:hypothetical protein